MDAAVAADADEIAVIPRNPLKTTLKVAISATAVISRDDLDWLYCSPRLRAPCVMTAPDGRTAFASRLNPDS
jgi:hypothetical protein